MTSNYQRIGKTITGQDGIHGGRKAWKLAQVDEMDALADTLERLYG